MMGFDPVSMMAAGYILAAAEGCPAIDPPVLNLQLEQNPPLTYEDQSIVDISRDQVNSQVQGLVSDNPVARMTALAQVTEQQKLSVEGASWFTGGYMQGNLTSKGAISFKVVPQGVTDGTQVACVYVDKVDLTLVFNPEVHIAAEWASRPCAHQVVTAHENSHVLRDLYAISQFMPRAKIAMADFLNGMSGEGPMPADQTQPGADALSQQISGLIVNSIYPPLEILRAQYQAEIDNDENYRREWALCPAEDWHIEGVMP
ncbi:MAG: hypothetical protein EPN97_11755 [Alphaproteobacteria bacterium]|nr:MAG: hypothetical protein EPN97_11755 [Alphaproteobacteria bacterium]